MYRRYASVLHMQIPENPKAVSCVPLVVKICMFILITAAVVITVFAYARNKTDIVNSEQSTALLEMPIGISRRSTPSLYEQDLLDSDSIPVSLADPLAVQAGEAIRNAFNAQRATACPSIDRYDARGDIQYVKKLEESNGTVIYTMEIDFGDDVVFARVSLLPNNLGSKFQLIVSVPGPCESGVQEQLAVSARVVNLINSQNLSWTASLNKAYEGVQIKKFGLGLNSMSDAEKQAYLIELMTSDAESSTAQRTYSAENAEMQEQWSVADPDQISDENMTDAISFVAFDEPSLATSTTPIETTAELSTSTVYVPYVNLSRSQPIVAAPALQRRLPTEAITYPQPNDTDAAAEDNATSSIPSESPYILQPAAAQPERRVASSVSSASAQFTPPASFDARDIYKGQVPCKAYTVLDQGGCGACYAFATAASFSARVCRANPSASVSNVVISPQSLLDCSGGCSGGNVLSTFALLVSRPAVELWCDPYTGAKQACGSVCGTGNTHGALAGSVQQVGGAGAYGRRQMQLELVQGGPGVVTFMVMSDLFSYSSGVYTPSKRARFVAGHAVSLVGWGVDRGVPYWLCQNSWGADWGEQGFFRIIRGVDACGIESSSGLVVAKPLVKPVCPASDCSYFSTTRRDCSCKCPFGRSGPTCRKCSLNCRNGASQADFCTRCECRMGTWGKECEGGYSLSSLASCAKDAPSKITVTYAFTATVPSPTQTSFVGIYRVGEVNPFNYLASARICGTKYPTYNKNVNGGLCPSSGSFQLSRPTAPGQYKIVVVPWSPRNNLGQQGYYNLQDSNVIGKYTVLSSGCSSKSRAAAQRANDPATLLANRLAAASAKEASQLAAMKRRLDAVQPLRSAVLAQPSASLSIQGLSSSKPFVWMGLKQRICYTIPAYKNVNPKGLVLYVGNGASGSYYPNALGAGDRPLPAGSEGCSDFTISRGVAAGRYTIALEDTTTGNPFATVSFATDQATVTVINFAVPKTGLELTVKWKVPAVRASPRDKVMVYSPRGALVHWFYTSCNCQKAPGKATVPTGTHNFKLVKDPTIRGAYIVKLHPAFGGAQKAAAVAADWVPWAKLGW